MKYEEELARERVGRRKESGKQDPFLWAQCEGTWVLAGTKVACEGVAMGEAGETGRCQVLAGSLDACPGASTSF